MAGRVAPETLRKQLDLAQVQLREASRELLDAGDAISDILNGVRLWRRTKENDWTDADECLIRWIEGSCLDDEHKAVIRR